MITVEEMMTTSVQCLTEADTLDKALFMMEKYGYHHIPVVNDDKLVGLVTHRDVLAALGSSLSESSDGPAAAEIKMGAIMIRDVFTISPQTPLRKAALYIRTQRYGCLPVGAGRQTGRHHYRQRFRDHHPGSAGAGRRGRIGLSSLLPRFNRRTRGPTCGLA